MKNFCLHDWTDFDRTGKRHCRKSGCNFVSHKDAIVTETPIDYLAPDWVNYEKVHCWRNHINDRIKGMWNTFTADQKAAIAISARELANAEEWS